MNRIEHYHDWLRDAHAMEKQAEKMLESMASRIETILSYVPELSSTLAKQRTSFHSLKAYLIVIIFRALSLKTL